MDWENYYIHFKSCVENNIYFVMCMEDNIHFKMCMKNTSYIHFKICMRKQDSLIQYLYEYIITSVCFQDELQQYFVEKL